MTETIILRFRDLVTQAGETLIQHKELIDQFGSVWWGWWKRPYEEVPAKLFSKLRATLPMNIFLLDTGGANGTLHLYPARLIEIAQSPTGSPIPSPDPAYTPTYYNNNWLHVWFRFDQMSITRIPTAVELTIKALPTWPTHTTSDVAGYIGTTIADPAQLRRIDVTLWHVDVDEKKT